MHNMRSLPTGVKWPFRVCGEGVERLNQRTGVWELLVGTPDNAGYRVVSWKGLKGRVFKRLHVVVFMTHWGMDEIPRGVEVNHIDHDKGNNRISNLELVSHRENLAKARAFHGNWNEKNLKLTDGQRFLLLQLTTDMKCLSALAARWGICKFSLANMRHRRVKELASGL